MIISTRKYLHSHSTDLGTCTGIAASLVPGEMRDVVCGDQSSVIIVMMGNTLGLQSVLTRVLGKSVNLNKQ